MSDEAIKEAGVGELLVRGSERAGLVVRTKVPPALSYGEYKPFLRRDFFHACAYCTMSEAEARAIRFTIDHYEPQEERKDLVNEYSNLMYSCDTCNTYKSDRYQPPEARKDGFRFFRPDEDYRNEHFARNEIWLRDKTNTGFYTIEALDLNRQALLRLRELRQRLSDCDQYVVEGILALRSFPIDTLPTDIRARAIKKIKEAQAAAEDIGAAIDELLREYAKSPFVDPDTELAERVKTRAENLQAIEALYPGSWRAPRKRRAGKRKK